jgi:hypothetical protein
MKRQELAASEQARLPAAAAAAAELTAELAPLVLAVAAVGPAAGVFGKAATEDQSPPAASAV